MLEKGRAPGRPTYISSGLGTRCLRLLETRHSSRCILASSTPEPGGRDLRRLLYPTLVIAPEDPLSVLGSG